MLTSPTGHVASLTGDVAPTLGRCDDLLLEMYQTIERCASLTLDTASPAENAASPGKDLSTSPKSWICDTAVTNN